MEGAPDDPAQRLSYVNAVSQLISQVAPVTVEIGQDSGSDRTLFNCSLELMMIGDYDGTERAASDWWPQ